jgi:hypothetical protein
MSKPSVRENRALHTWIAFPSEQLRRAYVQASAAIIGATTHEPSQQRRLRLLIRALGGDQTIEEPNDG